LNAPDWCKAPFDPEGLLSSLSAIGSCFLGLHFGHVLVHRKEHLARVWDWIAVSVTLLLTGVLLHLLGMPFNKPIYSVSYMLFTGGAAGVVFTGFYLLVDVHSWRYPTLLLEWLGQNALLMYVLVAEGVFPAALQGLYWKNPENNLVDLVELAFENLIESRRWAKLADVLCEILFACFVAGCLKYKGLFWKL
jgi:heparan-alpha-glucosaminide N-acetyltransferase